jgi:hypothetical protein
MLFEKKILKQYGLPRSGTNYFKWIIENNYLAKVLVNKKGWKHGECLTIGMKNFATIKNPYAWCLSVHKFIVQNFRSKKWSPFETELGESSSIEDFMGNKFKMKSEQKCYEFENPILYWNFAVKNWHECGVNIIKYEDLLIDMHEKLYHLKLKRIADKKMQCIVLPGMEKTLIKEGSHFDYKYYLDQEYMYEINKNCRDILKMNIDFDLAKKMQYEII